MLTLTLRRVFQPFRRSVPRPRKSGRMARPLLAAEILEDRTLLSVNALSGFDGIDFAHSVDGAPPDTIAAVGPNYVVEAVNTDLAIYNKANGSEVFHQDLADFFAPVRTGNFRSDPVVAYDEQAGRFFVGVLDLNIDLFFGTVNSDRFMFAVSDSSDPTGGFTEMHSIDMTGSSGVFADYPRIGWNADGYFVSFNMFTTGLFNFYDSARIIAIDKGSVTDFNNATFNFTQTSRNTSHFTMAPATMHGSNAGDPMYFVEEAIDGNGNPTGQLRVTAMNNALTSPTFTDTLLTVDPYTQPPAAEQQGSNGLITTNDTRILNTEWRNNTLVAAQTVGVNGDSDAHARWYQIDTTSPTPNLTDQGTIGVGSGSNSYFPSIAISPNGDVGMTFIQSSANEYMSMYVTGRSAAGTMQTPVLAKAGEAVYSASFDSSPYRAGDYSGITVDPINGTFWAANEYAKTPDPTETRANWGTWVQNFSLQTGPPDTIPPAVTVNSPNGGENWAAGSTQTIAWTATDDVGVSSVDLQYSTDGGTGFTIIATGETNDGAFSWTVPDTPTTSALIKVVAHDAAGNSAEDVSDGIFTITDQTVPTVTVIQPNGGETWSVGSTQNITWNASDNVGVTAVDLSYSTDGGSTFATIAIGETNDGTYGWIVPNTLSTNAFVRIVAHDAAGNSAADLSDAAFTITDVVTSTDDPANGESTTLGQISAGTYLDTRSSDNVYEQLTEQHSGGKPSQRVSSLEHTWEFNVTGGSSVTFYVEGYRPTNSEGDNFKFEYSNDGSSYQELVTIDSDVEQTWFASLASSTTGTVYIRVMDTDRTVGNGNTDSLFIDHMFIRSQTGPVTPVTDIAVTSVTAASPVVKGDVVSVDVTVKNTGTEDVTSPITVSLTESPDGSAFSDQTISGGLAAGASTTVTFSWDTSAASLGDHTLTATQSFADDNAANDTGSTTVTVNQQPGTGSANDIYVWDMAWSDTAKGPWYNVSATVFIKQDSDADGAERTDDPVGGATLTVAMDHYEFLFGIPVLVATTTFSNVTTNGQGQVKLTLKTQSGGDFVARVISLDASSPLTWNMALDQDNPSYYQGVPGGQEVDNLPYLTSIGPADFSVFRAHTIVTSQSAAVEAPLGIAGDAPPPVSPRFVFHRPIPHGESAGEIELSPSATGDSDSTESTGGRNSRPNQAALDALFSLLKEHPALAAWFFDRILT